MDEVARVTHVEANIFRSLGKQSSFAVAGNYSAYVLRLPVLVLHVVTFKKNMSMFCDYVE